MSWRDAIGLAARELRRRPARAALTTFAVALAAALLSALLAVAGTAQTRVLSQLANGGPLAAITVAPAAPDPTQAGLDNPRPGPARDLTPAAMARIRTLPHVASVLGVTSADVDVIPPPVPPAGSRLCNRAGACGPGATDGPGSVQAFGTDIVGVNLGNTASLPVTLVAGRFPAPNSLNEVDVTQGYLGHVGLTQSQAAAVVGSMVGIRAFRFLPPPRGSAPFGIATVNGAQTRPDIGFRANSVQVVGVVDQQAGSGDVLAWPPLVQADFRWLSAGRAFGDSNAPTSPYQGAVVLADQLTNVPAVRTAIADVGYTSSAPENVIISVNRYLHVVELVLSGIGVVALAIAALGISNALLAAVRERRREIGVLKAIGARDRDVMRVFLVEAGTLGFVGGVIGTILGAAIALSIGAVANHYLTTQGLKGATLSLPPLLLAGTILGSTLVALMAGAVPAVRAAHLPPREAVEG